MEKIAKEDKNVKIISFSRNFGHQAAVTAGLKNVSGRCNCYYGCRPSRSSRTNRRNAKKSGKKDMKLFMVKERKEMENQLLNYLQQKPFIKH